MGATNERQTVPRQARQEGGNVVNGRKPGTSGLQSVMTGSEGRKELS
jgi:hypothetical protein